MRLDISLHDRITLPAQFTFEEFLAVFVPWMLAISREILVCFLHALDALVYERIKTLGGKIACYQERSLVTSLGELVFRYRQVRQNGTYFSPLLKFLHIAPRVRITEECATTLTQPCLFTSFRKAWEAGGKMISVGSLWNRFQEWGASYRQKEQDVIRFYREGDPSCSSSPYHLALVMIDGNWIRKQGGKHFEVKGARLVLGRGDTGSWEWTDPVVYANNCSCQAFLKQCSELFDALYGLRSVPHILVVSDAASWIKKFCHFYPQAIHQLDWWHLWKMVKTLHFCGDEVYDEVWGLLMVERLSEAVEKIREVKRTLEDFRTHGKERCRGREEFSVLLRRETSWLDRRLKEVDALLSYLLNNQDCLYAVKALQGVIPAEAFVFGSGPVEKLMGTLIGYRMKKQGRSWSVKGACHMSGLLSAWYNGDEFMSVLERYCGELAFWEGENERLSGMRFCEVPSQRWYGDWGNLPIVSRGKNDTALFPFLQEMTRVSKMLVVA